MWESLLLEMKASMPALLKKNLSYIFRNLNLHQFILYVDTRKLNTILLIGWLKIHMKGVEVLSSLQRYFFEVLNLGFCRCGHSLAAAGTLPECKCSLCLCKNKTAHNMFLIFGGQQPEPLWFSDICSSALAALSASSLLLSPELNCCDLWDICLLGRVNCYRNCLCTPGEIRWLTAINCLNIMLSEP